VVNDPYKTFRVSLRPPRVACLINSHDANWQAKILIAIESFSRTWGGAGFIIIPTDGKTISETFWEILLSYDADYLWISYQTNEHFEFPLILSDELVKELKLRLAPFHYDDSHLTEQDRQTGYLQNLIIKGGTYPDFKAEYPYTDTITILPNCEHPNGIAEIANLEGLIKVWVASTTGLASSTYQDELQEIGIESRSFDYSENQTGLFDIVVKGIQRDLVVEDVAFPFNFAKSKLGLYRSFEFAYWKEATLVITGEALEDFCLYFCLSRMRSKVAWLLTSWLPKDLNNQEPLLFYQNTPISHFATSLRNLEWENGRSGTTHFMSVSLGEEILENIRELFRHREYLTIANGLPFDETQLGVENHSEDLAKSIKFLLRYPFRVYETGNSDKIVSKHFIGSNMAGFFEPPKPKNFSKIDKDHHWVSDFSIDKQHFPRHPLLGKEIIKEPMTYQTHARVGKDSIAFVDPRTGYINDDIDSWLRKPEIYLPTAYNIFELLFRKNGYKTDISDKGRFAATAISKFGNLSILADFLTSRNGKVFDRYSINAKDNPKDGGLFLKSDRRSYLSFQTFETVLGEKITASNLLNYLLLISAIHRGSILKCQLCRNTDWYHIAELSNEFQCKRCSLKQVYSQSHALNQPEPNWYYKLDEVVYQAILHNSKVPILATNHLRKMAKIFDFCPELELRNISTHDQFLELDICCIQDGKLSIGEAKTTDYLANSKREENALLTKYFELSEKIGVSQVIFATASKNWQENTQRRILSRFSSSLTKVIILTQKDLFA